MDSLIDSPLSFQGHVPFGFSDLQPQVNKKASFFAYRSVNTERERERGREWEPSYLKLTPSNIVWSQQPKTEVVSKNAKHALPSPPYRLLHMRFLMRSKNHFFKGISRSGSPVSRLTQDAPSQVLIVFKTTYLSYECCISCVKDKYEIQGERICLRWE